jgi:NTE family protein
MSRTIGISLAGGGARGIAHIGVLQALEEHGISPQFVSGSSAGAIAGVLYAAGYSPQEMLTIFKEASLLKLFRVSMPTVGLTDLNYVSEELAKYIKEDDFAILPKQFFVCVTNMSKGCYEIFDQGPLFEAVVASSSIPILFKPCIINEKSYADGGLLNNLPIEPLEDRCKVVIGVNVTPINPVENSQNLLQIGYRTLDLVMWANVQERLQRCDVVIEPATAKYKLFEIDKADEIYQAGYEAAMAAMQIGRASCRERV